MSTSPALKRPWLLTTTIALIFGLMASGAAVAAQESLIPAGSPVDIHPGTCEDIVAEPAFDGGDIVETNTNEVWDYETFQLGIFNDDQLDATGVDFNGDGQLQPEEIITPNDVDAPVGQAEMDLGETVATDEPHVVAVHADADDGYGTIIACGSIQDAIDQDGNLVVHIMPMEGSNNFGFATLTGDTSYLTTYLFQPNQVAPTGAAGAGQVDAHPVDIHTGMCQDFTQEPAYDIGDFQLTNAYAQDEQAPGDMSGEVPAVAEDLGPVYKIDRDDVDYGDDDALLTDGGHVVAVHQSSTEYGTIIACGQILPTLIDGDTYVFLHPVDGGNMSGFVAINSNTGLAEGFMWEQQDYMSPAQEATPTPQPDVSPVAPTETAVVEATAVVTEVVTETEVVPAEEATETAMAEGDAASEPVEVTEVEIGGEEAVAITASAGQTLTVVNSSENERVVSIPDLQIEQTVTGGEQVEVQIPEDAQTGSFSYEVLEDGTSVLTGELTVE